MKVNCQIEALLCVDSFKTIDLLLLQEGMYQLRFSLYLFDEQAGIKIPLKPKETFQTTTQSQPRTSYRPKQQIPTKQGFRDQKKRTTPALNKDWIPSHILKDLDMFCTAAFLIRTWTEEEKIQIQNGCRFSAQFPLQYQSTPLFIEVELMYHELNNQNQSVASFKCIALSKYKVHDLCSGNFILPIEGVYEYIPVVFNDEQFHLVNLCFYSTLTDFKFHVSHTPQQESPFMAIASAIQTQKVSSKQQVQHLIHPKARQLRELYVTLVQPLRNSYQALNEFHNHLDLEMAYQERKSSTGGSTLVRYNTQRTLALLPISCLKELEVQSRQDLPERGGDSDFHTMIHLSKQLATEYQIVQSLMHQMWLKVQQLVKQRNYHFIRTLKMQQAQATQQRYARFVCKENIHLVDHSHTMVPSQTKQNLDSQECVARRATVYQSFGPSKVIDLKIEKELKDRFIILEKHFLIAKTNFKQDYERLSQLQQKGKMHLIVFVHGYQGHPFDMRLFENYLCLRYPQHMFMISIANQNNTEGDILKMGIKLAEEVAEFIQQWCPEKTLSRLSFVAHSLGGLIVRASLPHLQQYSEKMYTIVTLGSPHLGYLHNSHGLIKFGLWMLQKFKKSQCLQQLTMKDADDPEEFALTKISKMQGLGWFKNVILLGSSQDHYVTSESSLIMKVDARTTDVHNQIAHNILRTLTQSEIIRVTVDFNFDSGDLDTFLGRKAHIAILESHFLLEYITYNLGEYFK